MKRLNPDTGKPFVRGDTRADGFLFLSYRLDRLKKNGFFSEKWTTPKKLKEQKIKDKLRYSNNSEKLLAYCKEYTKQNYLKVRSYQANWRKQNKHKVLARQVKRRAAKINRTPPWLTKEQLSDIEEFYMIAKMFQMYTGEIYHVDHIVPLQGKCVSGLHVPWNLQVLHYKDNLAKNNLFLD